MRRFFDEENKWWTINLTFGKADEIAVRCERPDSSTESPKYFDMFNITDRDQAEYFVLHDPKTGRFNRNNADKLVNVIYVLCEDQCKERGMTDKQFGEMLATAVFGRAYAALMEEIENFIQDPEDRAMFQSLLFLAGGNRSAVLSEANRALNEKKIALIAQTTQIVTDKLETAWKPVKAMMDKAAEENGTTTSLNVPVRVGFLYSILSYPYLSVSYFFYR